MRVRIRMYAVCMALLVAAAPGAQAAVDCSDGGRHPVHCGKTPSATFDAQGRLWVVYARNDHAWVTVSGDRGETFSSPVQVNKEPEAIDVNGENRPKIVVAGEDHVYISWTRETEGMFTGDIRFARSTDGGRHFEEPVTVNDDGLLTSHRFESLFLSDSGLLYITWLDKREQERAVEAGEDYHGSAVFYAVSRDRGASFSVNHKVADHSCECCRIAVAPHDRDGVALMWRHIYDGSTRDHAIATIGPGGNAQYQARASHDDWRIEACPHHGPDMSLASPAVDQEGAAYHLAWFANGNANRGIHYGRHETGSGKTMHVHQVDPSAGAAHPQVLEYEGQVYLVWKHYDGERMELRMIRSSDRGRSWSDYSVVASTRGASDHPLLIEGPEGPFVSWHTREEGYRLLPAGAAGFEPRPFTADSFKKIRAEYEGEPFLLGLWSVTCPPCMQELEMLGRLRERMPDLPLVLVSTDHIRHRDRAEDFLVRYGLEDMRSWMFAGDHSAELRYSIDPQWYGELPRSYFFDADHQPEAHSGVLTREQVRTWLGL